MLSIVFLSILINIAFLWAQTLADTKPATPESTRLRPHLYRLEKWDVVKLLRAKKQLVDRQKKLAATSNHPEELSLLATDDYSEVRFFVAVNPHTPIPSLLTLAKDPLPHVRGGVAMSLINNTLGYQEEREFINSIGISLAQDPHPLVRLALASNLHIPYEVIAILVKDRDPLIRQKLGENLNLPQQVLEWLAQDSVLAVQVQALRHRNASSRMLLERTDDPAPDIRLSLARNNNTPLEALERLVNDASTDVRQAVAEHPEASLEILERLAGDKEVGIVIAVARHPQANQKLLLKLAVDTRASAIRETAKTQLAELLRSEIREDILERW